MKMEKLREKMFGYVEQWYMSGISQAAFCRRHNLTKRRLNYWVKQYDRHNACGVQNFLPLQIERPIEIGEKKVSGTTLCIHYPNGVSLEIHGDLDRDQIAGLIRTF